MGNQLLSKAAGATIYKLKYGHRSHNQPVRMVGTNNCYITSQNHGYAVDAKTLGNDWEELFVNMNDGSNEGIRHKMNLGSQASSTQRLAQALWIQSSCLISS